MTLIDNLNLISKSVHTLLKNVNISIDCSASSLYVYFNAERVNTSTKNQWLNIEELAAYSKISNDSNDSDMNFAFAVFHGCFFRWKGWHGNNIKASNFLFWGDSFEDNFNKLDKYSFPHFNFNLISNPEQKNKFIDEFFSMRESFPSSWNLEYEKISSKIIDSLATDDDKSIGIQLINSPKFYTDIIDMDLENNYNPPLAEQKLNEIRTRIGNEIANIKLKSKISLPEAKNQNHVL